MPRKRTVSVKRTATDYKAINQNLNEMALVSILSHASVTDNWDVDFSESVVHEKLIKLKYSKLPRPDHTTS